MTTQSLFSYYPGMSDDQFWEQILSLDEANERMQQGFGGFAIRARSPKGERIEVPYVNFARVISSVQN